MASRLESSAAHQAEIRIATAAGSLGGTLLIPFGARGIVLFAHGSGSSRFSVRNRFVAESFVVRGLGALLIDLLTSREEQVDAITAEHRFDIGLLAERLIVASGWLAERGETRDMALGYFGASTGAAAALRAAASRDDVAAIVSRGGRPDLAGSALRRVRPPTLLIVGARDNQVLTLNRQAFEKMDQCSHKEIQVVAGATHLFEEPGTLEQVAKLAGDWFERWLAPSRDRPDS
jgi:dienelactone hydrolase